MPARSLAGPNDTRTHALNWSVNTSDETTGHLLGYPLASGALSAEERDTAVALAMNITSSCPFPTRWGRGGSTATRRDERGLNSLQILSYIARLATPARAAEVTELEGCLRHEFAQPKDTPTEDNELAIPLDPRDGRDAVVIGGDDVVADEDAAFYSAIYAVRSSCAT